MPESGVVDPAARDKYLLQVTAGPSYDESTHRVVAVNGPDAHMIENDVMKCWLKVRIRDYHGLPRGSPSTNNYFDHSLHRSDRYSIGFSFEPKKDIPGNDLVTGFDFDHSIRDRLPPGFRYAMKIVTTILDPGIYSDPYSDKPYLYGPALSSFFSFRIGEHESKFSIADQLGKQIQRDAAGVIEEGADGSGKDIREKQAIPPKASKRRKNFLTPKNLENFTFEAGRLYQADFFNPYLDFANFALRIPGFSISVVRYIDDKTHHLRFVLKNRRTEEVLFVVIFTLLYGQRLEDTLEKLASSEPSEAKATQTEEVGDRSHTPNTRPETSSSNETHTPLSRASSAPDSDVEDTNGAGVASTLANSIYSGMAALGFGRQDSSSSESSRTNSTPGSKAGTVSGNKETSPERQRKSVTQLEDEKVEDYLRGKHSNVA